MEIRLQSITILIVEYPGMAQTTNMFYALLCAAIGDVLEVLIIYPLAPFEQVIIADSLYIFEFVRML